MNFSSLRTLILLALVPALAGIALSAQALREPNRFTVGPRFGFSLEADFKAAPALSLADPGPATGGGVSRTYDDGFVGVDAGGNVGGQTWYWGYENAAQVDLAADALALSALQGGTAPEILGVTEDLQVGAEATFQRLLGEFGGARWGIELGGLWLPVDLESNDGFAATLTQVTDVYSLGGTVPPAAPYRGSFAGPGPTIGDVPTRTEVTQDYTILGSRRIESTLIGGRFGPLLEMSVGEPLFFQVSAGLVVMHVDSEFSYAERPVPLAPPGVSVSASSSQQDVAVGGYARGQLILRVSERLGVFAAAEYQALSDLDLAAGAREATLKLGGGVYGSAGIEVRF